MKAPLPPWVDRRRRDWTRDGWNRRLRSAKWNLWRIFGSRGASRRAIGAIICTRTWIGRGFDGQPHENLKDNVVRPGGINSKNQRNSSANFSIGLGERFGGKSGFASKTSSNLDWIAGEIWMNPYLNFNPFSFYSSNHQLPSLLLFNYIFKY